MQEADRLSVILAAQRPIPLALRLGTQDMEELKAAMEDVRPQQIVDMVPAIETALAQAARDNGGQSIVVCLTSGLEHVAPSERERLSALAAEAAERGARLEVVRLSAWQSPDATSAALAAAGAGDVHHAPAEGDVWAILYRLLNAKSPVAARDVALSVQFDPRVVGGYRILGHEDTLFHPIGKDDRRGVELLLGQSSVAMFEVKLRGAAGGSAGAARLTWVDQETGAASEAVKQVSTEQFAATVAEAALPMQRATLAAMTAEVLRRVRYVPRDASLKDVLELADALDGRLWSEPWFVELVDAIEAALSLGPSRDR
jgi:Ca-activated chloride channel family protein